MSSDYIARLRAELLRAGASEQTRRRPARAARALRPLAATAAGVAAVAIVGLAIVVAWPAGRSDERPAGPREGAVELTYRVEPSDAAEQTADVMRQRLAASGIDGAQVVVSSSGELAITAPAASRADVTALTQQGRVVFYDWEGSVLGPGGTPAPTDANVTGGSDPGRAAAITKAEAEARAARLSTGRVVRAADGGDRWFALGGEPALTNADIAHAQPAVVQAANQPIVAIELTPQGQTAFTALTRELAHRGRARAADGVSDLEVVQHIAIVIDDRIVSMPFIDFRQAPNGLDGSLGAQIADDMTPQAARRLASIVTTGPLPATLSGPE
jgi:preprotein translocase subunit SecD